MAMLILLPNSFIQLMVPMLTTLEIISEGRLCIRLGFITFVTMDTLQIKLITQMTIQHQNARVVTGVKFR